MDSAISMGICTCLLIKESCNTLRRSCWDPSECSHIKGGRQQPSGVHSKAEPKGREQEGGSISRWHQPGAVTAPRHTELLGPTQGQCLSSASLLCGAEPPAMPTHHNSKHLNTIIAFFSFTMPLFREYHCTPRAAFLPQGVLSHRGLHAKQTTEKKCF